MSLAAGELFAGYRIERLLGAGAMGEVYLAGHPRLPRRDALKVLAESLTADSEFRQRFQLEADLAATLFHPNIVGVHDRGEYGGRLWIAMDYVDGTDAARLLRDHYPQGMPTAEVVEVITGIAGALDYAHQHGLLHRDVKPGNILLTAERDGVRRILLADFGIARPLSDVSGLTATNFTLGTLDYAGPEQLMGADLDGRADQYALAATAFHLLTGAPPYPGGNPVTVISRHLTADPARLSQVRPELARLDGVLTRALAKDPAARFSDCQAFARALAEVVGTAATSRAATAAARPGETVAARFVSGLRVGVRRSSTRRQRRVAGATAVIGIAGLIGWAANSGEADDSHSLAVPQPTRTTDSPSAAAGCDAQPWPRQLPNLIGKPLGAIRTDTIRCFNITAATAPDGHNVLNDPIGAVQAWTITGASPAAGGVIEQHQAITLTVVPLVVPTETVVQTAVAPTTAVTAPPPLPVVSTPAGASAQCVDGTYSFAKHRTGACSNHGGVDRWLAPVP